MSEIPKIAYLHFRSYGDLIINLYCRNFFFIETIDYVSLYLHDLFNQIVTSPKNVVKLENIKDKPAFIDTRRSKFYDVLKSGLQLRNAFKQIKKDAPDHLIFQDYKRWQQDIYFGTLTQTPKKLDNVYKSHISFYKKIGAKAKSSVPENLKNDGVIRIFPYSSLNYKNIKPNILHSLCDYLNLIEKSYEVVYLDGDKIFEFKHNYIKIPKTFDKLIAKLKYSSLNISCDSLPAHLSSFYNIDTIVLIPENGKYWLPLNAYYKNNFITLESLHDKNYTNLFELVDKNCFNKI